MSASYLDALLALDGRIALVAGGSGGIGSAIVELLARAGARVVSVDREKPAAAAGARRSFVCDLSDSRAVTSLFADLASADLAPDVIVHAVGITRDHVLWNLDDEDWRDVLHTNLDSAFLLLRAAVPAMRERRRGAVVLLSSINGERGKVGQANYAASKAGLIGMAKTAARELGRSGIRVNVVAPGLVRTAMSAGLPPAAVAAAVEESALGRVAEPDDVARAVLFLCSDLARHVTGQVLRVDGGQLIA